MKKSLVELMQIGPKIDVVGPEVSLNAWAGVPFAQLSVVLVHLRYLAMLHQTHHWIAKGDTFYGDHLLYMRLYEKVRDEVDTVAEKAVGMGNEENVCLCTQVDELHKIAEAMDEGDEVPTPEGLAKKSLVAEQAFIKVVEAMCESMKTQGIETPGIENMLQGICDVHEGHVYLLKQRCAQSTSGF